MRTPRRWKAATILLATVVSAVTVQYVLAASTKLTGGGVQRVTVVRDLFGGSVDETEGWQPVATTHITVPNGKQHLVIARLSADVSCGFANGTPTAPDAADCVARVLIDGTEAEPQSPATLGFCNKDDCVAPHDHLALGFERSCGPLGPGRYEIQVQVLVARTGANPDPETYFIFFQKLHLTVEQVLADPGQDPAATGCPGEAPRG